jgi:hypothetical protein
MLFAQCDHKKTLKWELYRSFLKNLPHLKIFKETETLLKYPSVCGHRHFLYLLLQEILSASILFAELPGILFAPAVSTLPNKSKVP